MTYRRNDARAIGPHQSRLVLRLEHVRDPHHVVLRDTLRYAHDQTNFSLDRLLDASSCERRWYEDSTGIRASLFDRVCHSREDGLSQML